MSPAAAGGQPGGALVHRARTRDYHHGQLLVRVRA
jgi:hypothetical protein